MEKKARETVSETGRDAYRHWTTITIRYRDTDAVGHINNAVYCTYLEAGRADFLYDSAVPLCGPDRSYVIVKLTMDYLKEVNYPGVVEVGTRVDSIGRSSFALSQAVFYKGECCSTARSVLVVTDNATRRSTPVPPAVLERLESLKA